MTLDAEYGSVMFQAWPEVSDPCHLCGRDTLGCYVIWSTSAGELVHVCDECMADRDDGGDPEEGEFLREGQPEFNGAFGNG